MMWYHGTQGELSPGDLIVPGYPAHVDTGDPQGLVWFSVSEEMACFWGCERDGEVYDSCHVYEVSPTGTIMPDRGIATKQVPKGNYQSWMPLRVIREV